jgi:gas vesicle protein
MNDNTPYTQGAGVAGTSVMSFVMGAVVGASLALLLAPENGAQTRHRIAEVAKRVGQRVRHSAEDLANDAREAVEHGRQEFQQDRPGKTRAGV